MPALVLIPDGVTAAAACLKADSLACGTVVVNVTVQERREALEVTWYPLLSVLVSVFQMLVEWAYAASPNDLRVETHSDARAENTICWLRATYESTGEVGRLVGAVVVGAALVGAGVVDAAAAVGAAVVGAADVGAAVVGASDGTPVQTVDPGSELPPAPQLSHVSSEVAPTVEEKVPVAHGTATDPLVGQ